MNTIPKEIKDFSESAELFDVSEKIGNQFGLHIDQIGELDSRIRAILRGLASSKSFSDEIKKVLEITPDLASKITEEVNKQVFQVLKTKMQDIEKSSISDLEKIGNFTIDKPEREEAEEKTESLKTMSDETVTSTHREALLNALENPEPTPQLVLSTKDDVHTEPLVDLLMNKPTSIPEERVVKVSPAPTPVTTPKVEPVKKVAPGPDPYRETID
jgi:curved DNA-binding protein CbpA